MKKTIDILSIVLPVLIIALGVTRLFVKKTKGFNGLTMFFAILLLIAGLIRIFFFPGSSSNSNNEPPPQPLSVSKHSPAFNTAIQGVLNAYFKMADVFVNSDTLLIRLTASELKSALDSFSLDDLKRDSLIYLSAQQPYENCKSEVSSIISDPSLDEKRASLNILSQELFQLLNTVKYDLGKIYWLECENAFGDEKPGDWLSQTEKGQNPYAKTDCTELKSTINNVPDSTAGHARDSLKK